MAKKKQKTSSSKPKPWLNRLISAVIFIVCFLMVLALAYGPKSLDDDWKHLQSAAGFAGWFSSETQNLVGVFGILMGNLCVYLLGYVFSLLSFILIGIIALLYFLEPQTPKGRQKLLLFLIVIFLLQILLSHNAGSAGYGILPGALYSLLTAVFSSLGTTIILITAIVLSVILILEWQRLKTWSLALMQSFTQREPKVKPEKPTINQDVPAPAVKEEEQKDSTPVIHGHEDTPPVEPEKEAPAKKKEEPKKEKTKAEGDRHEYVIPSINDFLESPVKLSESDRKEIEAQILSTSSLLKDKLAEFGIEAEVRNVNIGPIITQYELEPAKGVKVNKFASLADDLALAIKARSIRVQAPIPGRGLIGIEIPNHTRDMIYLKDLLLCEEMKSAKSRLMFGLGKDIAGKPVVTDLSKMPHLLIAGATGSGKSVCINTIIMSLILRSTPDEVRLLLIDPKRVELAGYNELPHLIGNVVTEPDDALENMFWAVREMERRYELLQEAKVRDLAGYNEKALREKELELEPLPAIVIIVDEFADLIMTSGKEIELPITRLAQMARAVGIHLILATQRPSIKVITGIIKANFPARIAFQVSSRVDSRVILDMIGAERLLGLGDMLFLPPGKAMPIRIHGAYVSDSEIARVCDFLAMQPKPELDFSLPEEGKSGFNMFDYDDELFPEAAIVVVRTNTASVSMLQRHFKIGYARAGRLVDLLERAHIVGPHAGSKSRDVLASRDDLIRLGFIREEE
ncbi:MAG TPA: DNA translocase FtsK 4TM domain-containing protein [Candidatus Cloacimonadota bacterium]|nr:DNA translocase FtsK 4TM domain-containing protein [Candidatus Cloacimonadota bacterium]